MSIYKHRVTLICPVSLTVAANQLALITGESAADVNTFGIASYAIESGEQFAVCSTVVTDSFMAMQAGLPNLKLHAKGADVALAQSALDKLVIWQDGNVFDINAITMAVDIDPQLALSQMGLTRLQTEDVI